MTRQITNDVGETTYSSGSYPVFTYTDRAARLLTVQEINYSKNYDSTSLYLREKTKFANGSFDGWWVENPSSTYTVFASAFTYGGSVTDAYACITQYTSTYYVRPAIEVPISKIAY